MGFLNRVAGLFRRNRLERDLDEELQLHIELKTQEFIKDGMPPDEARYAALRQFGNIGQVKEECRDADRLRWLEDIVQDLRYGLRQLHRNPGFTAVAILTLALGIGASTVIFNLFDAVFLRPLPVRYPGRLVRVVEHVPKIGSRSSFYLDYIRALRDRARSFEFVFGQAGEFNRFAMSRPRPAEEITLRGVTPEFFAALGVPALYGRALRPRDATEERGAPPAVLSYSFWKRHFGGDPEVVKGRITVVNGQHFEVVGVMPRGFGGLSLDTAPELWIPARAYPSLLSGKAEAPISDATLRFELAARLRPGARIATAQAQCRAIWKPVMRDFYSRNFPKLSAQRVAQLIRTRVWLEPLGHGVSVLRLRYGDVLKLLMASVGLLFLIVCANVSGLILARNAARQQEVAVRLAIGATRWRLARQTLTESSILAAVGAIFGLLIAGAAMPFALTQLPSIRDMTGWPVAISLSTPISRTVFLFLLVLAIVAALVFWLAPAFANTRMPIDTVLRGSRSSVRLRGRQLLIVGQIGLCVMLLAATGLLVRTFDNLAHTDPGFSASHVAVFTENLTGQHAPAGLLDMLTARVREMPGVVSVGAADIGVMRGHGMVAGFAPAGRQVTSADWLNSDLNRVSPGYFRTMGMQILAGRDFTPADEQAKKATGPEKVVVNAAFAREFFSNVNPIGNVFGSGPVGEIAHRDYQIIGVVNDAKNRSLREPIRPEVFTPLTEHFSTYGFVLYVRTRRPAEAGVVPVQKALASIDPSLPVGLADTLGAEVHNNISGDRETAVLASTFGLAAVLLVCLGIYGLLAYSVAQRQKEIGIRMALGAEKSDVLWMVVGQGLKLALIGVAIGIAGALALTRFLASLLYGVKPTDPFTFAAVSLILIAVALLACYIPARRAAKVDPMVALRYE